MDGELKKNYGGLKRRPFLTPLWLAALAALIVVSFATWLWGTADSTTVIVIRHAEKAADGSSDPSLNAAGEARAQTLARMFGDARTPGRIDAIYVSAPLRNRLTAAPLAARLGLTPIVAGQDDIHAFLGRVLRENDGHRVLIVGHSDTVPAIVSALSGQQGIPAIGADDYGNMYIVTVPRLGHPIVLHVDY